MTRMVLFTDPYCTPCGMVKRSLNCMNDERISKVEIVSLYDDVEFAKKYGIKEVPTLVVINERGGIMDVVKGPMPIKNNIRRLLDEYYGET